MGFSSYNGQCEEFCLEDLCNGDHQAFKALFKEHYLQLTRFVWRYVDSKAVAEELVQEVFAIIWERREMLEVKGSIKPYLYKAARNRALNVIKHNKLKKEYDKLWMEERENGAMLDFEEKERIEYVQKRILEAIEELPARSKMTYKLHRYDGLTYEEIAEVMDVSVKTVESQMTRTLKMLREKLSTLLPYLITIIMVGAAC